MKLVQVFAASAVLLFGVASVRADSHSSDPRIIVGHPGVGSAVACGGNFTITADSSGGGSTTCKNTSGENWTGLIITSTIPAKTGLMFFCDDAIGLADSFSSCKVSVKPESGSKEQVTYTFTGGFGIPSGSTFSIGLNNTGLFSKGAGGFGDDGKLMVTAVIAPEPETILLLLMGLGGLCFLRRRVSSNVI